MAFINCELYGWLIINKLFVYTHGALENINKLLRNNKINKTLLNTFDPLCLTFAFECNPWQIWALALLAWLLKSPDGGRKASLHSTLTSCGGLASNRKHTQKGSQHDREGRFTPQAVPSSSRSENCLVCSFRVGSSLLPPHHHLQSSLSTTLGHTNIYNKHNFLTQCTSIYIKLTWDDNNTAVYYYFNRILNSQ